MNTTFEVIVYRPDGRLDSVHITKDAPVTGSGFVVFTDTSGENHRIFVGGGMLHIVKKG